jgi:4-hydroxy-2-oxoheptanedioate aldolase
MPFHPKRGFRQAIHSGDLLLGMFTRTGCGDIIEMAGFAGIDFVLIDTEHGPADGTDVRDLVRAAECAGLAPVVRPYANDPKLILRALDVGAVGIMVPHVRNRLEAENVVKAVKYYPDGDRSKCPLIRATRFTGRDWEEYRRVANEETAVILLLEDEEAMNNVEEIASVPGVDVLFVGASDLAASMGAERDDPRVKNAITTAISVARRKGIATHVSLRRNNPETLAYWYDQGCRIFHFTDVALFSDAIGGAVSTARATIKKLGASSAIKPVSA